MSIIRTKKSCVVPKCTNTTYRTPEKLFFCVPKEVKMRKIWINAMKRLDPFGAKSAVYCCEDHFDVPKKSYAVPKCTNSTKRTPEKLFFLRSNGCYNAKKWTKAMKRLDAFGAKSTVYCCEDHFDVEEDMDNYVKFKLVGGRLKLKKGVLPHKFECQKRQEKKIERTGLKKRQHIEYLKRVLSKDIRHEDLSLHSIELIECKNQDSNITQNSEEIDGSLPASKDIMVQMPHADKDADGRLHEGLCCECGGDVEGFRYVCAQCPVSLCGACAARGAHPAHYVLRIPHRATQARIDAVLSSLRAQLADDIDSVKIEIKEEPVDPLASPSSMEEDTPAVHNFDVDIKEEPLQEPMDETVALKIESKSKTSRTKRNKPLVKDSKRKRCQTLDPINSQCETEIPNEFNQACVPGTSSQRTTTTKKTTKRTVPPGNIPPNKITKTSTSVKKGRKRINSKKKSDYDNEKCDT